MSTSNAPVETLDSFDVAVRRGPAHWPNCVSGHFLGETEFRCAVPRSCKRSPIKVADDLARHVLLHSDTRPDAWRNWLSAAGVTVKCRKKQSFDHFYLALQAAVDGLGVALGPLPLLADELASGRLVVPLGGSANRCARLLVGGQARGRASAAGGAVLRVAAAQGDQTGENETGSLEAAR